MTSRPAEPAARGKLERTWFYIALLVSMVLCCSLVPVSASASVELEALTQAADAPSVERGDHITYSAEDLLVLSEETEDEDATSNMLLVASSSSFVRAPDVCTLALKRVIPADSGHLLISTGLGRGPPAA